MRLPSYEMLNMLIEIIDGNEQLEYNIKTLAWYSGMTPKYPLKVIESK